MKKIYFLSGMPRSGNTLLGSLINQNEEITVTGSSIVCSILYSISLLKEELAFKNFPDHKSLDNIYNNVFNNYYKDWKAKYIIDRGPWGTPGNLKLLKEIIKKPKFIILYRPVLEVLASFVKIEKPENIEERCDNYMGINKHKNGMVHRYLWSIENILKSKEDHIIIHYKDLINDPINEIKKIYKFLGIPFKNVELKNFKQFYANNLMYNDSVLSAELHKIRTDKVEQIKFNVEEILPINVIKKYSNLDVL
jgi:hypothetical protein